MAEVWPPEIEPRCSVLTLCSPDYHNLMVSFKLAFTGRWFQLPANARVLTVYFSISFEAFCPK